MPSLFARRCAARAFAAIWIVGFACGGPKPACAEVRLPAIFGDHMVLQRDAPLRVWGWADPGEEVEVSLDEQSATTTADDKGHWQVALDPEPAAMALELVARGAASEVRLADVAVGEVWVCSGQSNMQWEVGQASNADLELLSADRPDIRLISVHNPGSQAPADDFRDQWRPATRDAVARFSAVGYYFGKRVADALGVPVGLVDNSWGGSACEAWVPRERLAAAKFFAKRMRHWEELESKSDEAAERADFEKQMQQWRRSADAAAQRGVLAPERPFPRGFMLGRHRPGNLFNARVSPIAGYAMRGVIWYQGETNAGQPAEYRELFPLMITSWRDAWDQGDFPFYWVQLADYYAEATGPEESNWAKLREAQTLTQDRLPNTGQAVIIDLGEASDIHPRNKSEVANRLARLALAKDYGFEIACDSPRYDSMRIDGAKVTVAFRDVATKLRSVDAKEVQGFAVAGADGEWFPAEAKIVGRDRVEVISPEVAAPTAVSYGWANNPVVNLYDASGLPVTPFRAELAE